MNIPAKPSLEVPAALALRINSVLQSREFEFGKSITALRAQNPATAGNSHNGRIFGPHARAEINSVTPLLVQDYLQFCLDDSVHPQTHIDFVLDALATYADSIRASYQEKLGGAFASNMDASNLRLYDEEFDQALTEARNALRSAATGRIHGKLFYKYRHPILAFLAKHIVPIVVAAITAVLSTWATNTALESHVPVKIEPSSAAVAPGDK
ncbi:MAG: hypothetical protein ACYC18_14735 [Gammaproteobacteria bacterium]